MDDLEVIASDAHKMAIPEVIVPKNAPTWVREMFPPLIRSIYVSCNNNIEGLVVDFNRSLEHLQSQITEMKDTINHLTRTHATEMKTLKDTMQTKEYQVENQSSIISNLKETINKNESYSRRDNLIFGGLKLEQNDRRSCDAIIRDEIFINALHMSADDASSIKFVRCHFLTKRTGDNRSTIIARFESYRERTLIWNQRRTLKMVYVTEDFPYDIRRKRNKLKPILKAAGKNPQYRNCISMKSDKLLFKGDLLSVNNLHQLPVDINPRTLAEVKTDDVLIFGGINSDYYELSNYYGCDITYQNRKFNSIEQCYQHSKAVMFGDTRAATAILRATDPGEQKFLAKNIRGFNINTWNRAKVGLMTDMLHCKFDQHPNLAKKLCETGNLYIGEAIQKDTFYGIGFSLTHKEATDRKKWKTNKLGELLMAERTVQQAALNTVQ